MSLNESVYVPKTSVNYSIVLMLRVRSQFIQPSTCTIKEDETCWFMAEQDIKYVIRATMTR